MGFEQGTQNTFDVYSNETFSAVPTNGSVGSGGGAMNAWSDNRPNEMSALVRASYSMGTSNHTLPTGVTTGNASFDVGGVPGGEKSNASTPSGGESGSGGGDMYAWLYSRTGKLNALVTTTYSISTSNHSVPTAFVNSKGSPFDVGGVPGGEETMEALSSGGRSGLGGGDMTAWGYTRPNKIDVLVTSSYSMGTTDHILPTAVANSRTSPFDVGGVPSGEESMRSSPKGVTFGPNYYGLLVEGKVRAAPGANPSKPNPVTIADAHIEGHHTNNSGDNFSFSTAQKPDGSYALSVSDYGTWTVSTHRQYLGTETTTVDVQSKTTSNIDFTLSLGSTSTKTYSINTGGGGGGKGPRFVNMGGGISFGD